ncbi:trypsin- protease [Metarhizium guizhouense ARSEF 977]|uniref:Trypsin-protease n=1 Tax=Metarhizium guizhouense (strain ARSEF 977) TaxID=1276136 RepID=A0A0B4HZ56_METGA|nr:trypsin- protease [Metarhizium guizhouense ARSEF 977]
MVRKVATALAVAFSAISAPATVINKRIVGGEEAKDLSQFPCLVCVHPMGGPDHYCGGSLLDSTTVLTAAHCLNRPIKCGEKPEQCKGDVFSVRAASLDRETGGTVVEVASFKIHPSYHGHENNSYPHDIATLKLSTPIPESNMTRYAKLPASGSDPVANSIAIAAGWGSEEFSGPLPYKLRQAYIPIQARDGCKGAGETTVCAGGDGKDTCTGDSGGPLIDRETGQVVGIVSSGVACGNTGMYTRVASYIPFINENLGDSGTPTREQQLQDHCGRSGNDKDACMFAARRCTGQVKPDAKMPEFLQCVDMMQVCGEQDVADKTDQCIANAKVCREQEKLPLGDLDKLSRCAKKDL